MARKTVTLRFLNARPRNAGQLQRRYVSIRDSAKICGMLIANSCGGVYMHA